MPLWTGWGGGAQGRGTGDSRSQERRGLPHTSKLRLGTRLPSGRGSALPNPPRNPEDHALLPGATLKSVVLTNVTLRCSL